MLSVIINTTYYYLDAISRILFSNIPINAMILMKYKPFSDLEWSILAVDTPQWHQHHSTHYHTQYPTRCSYTSPLFLHLECYLQLIALDQLCMVLQYCCNICYIKIFSIQQQKNLPLQPTPASLWWSQLCSKIGLLEHSRSWLALEVQATSSK